MNEQTLTQQQSDFHGLGELLCSLFGRAYAHTEEYREMMEGCFTQQSTIMARGLEKLVSRNSKEIPLFLRGMLFQVSRNLKKECLGKAFKAARRALKYSRSLGFTSLSEAS